MATVLPAAFTAPDIRALLAHLGQTGTALSLGVAGGQGRWGDAEGAAVVADTCAGERDGWIWGGGRHVCA